MKLKSMTNGLYLPSLLINVFSKIIPTIVPRMQKLPTQIPQLTGSKSASIYVRVLAPVEKMIMYIPVADATFGGTPIDNKSGLKMEPPPSPRAPETHPPTKEKTMSLTNCQPSSLTSLLPSPVPYVILSICSLLTILTAMKQSAIQINR